MMYGTAAPPPDPRSIASNGMTIGSHPYQGGTVGNTGWTYDQSFVNHAKNMLSTPGINLPPDQAQYYHGVLAASGANPQPYVNALEQTRQNLAQGFGPFSSSKIPGMSPPGAMGSSSAHVHPAFA